MALGRAHTFLTLVAVLHHAVLPYTYFGHTDPKSWIGFDAVVLATDSFFIWMFFFLGGLPVWSGLRRGALSYLRDRLLRFGLPFTIAALTIMPVAEYAIVLRQTPSLGFVAFWWKTVTVGPWPSGPIWFLWVSLAFNLIASVLHQFSPKLLDPINHLARSAYERPATFFAAMLASTVVLYVPGRMYWGPDTWFEFGPFSVQQGRVVLYATYFFFGAGIGAANLDEGLLSANGRLANGSWGWPIMALVSYCGTCALIYVKREILGNPVLLPDWYQASTAVLFATFSVAIMFTILAYFLRFKQSGWSILDLMQADAYGMFVLHYPIVLWLQYWLFDFDISAIAKALLAFLLTLILSWAATATLRRLPGATHVL